MKIKYHRKDDILVLTFSNNTVDDAYELDNVIIEVDKNKAPISLEILHASKFINSVSKEMPKAIEDR